MTARARKATAAADDELEGDGPVEGESEAGGPMGDSGGHDDPSVCIIDDGRCVGKAGGINGLVCSAHAVHYRADGTRRA